MMTIGTESICAVRMPVIVFVAPGPEVTSTTAGSPAGARVPVRHVRGALLVPGEHELDRGIHQRIEQGNGRPAGQAENVFHALLLKHVHHALGARASSSASFLFHGFVLRSKVLSKLSPGHQILRRDVPNLDCGTAKGLSPSQL